MHVTKSFIIFMNKARTYRQYVKKYKLFLRIYCTFHEKYNQEKKSLKRLLEGQLKKKKGWED